MDDYLTVKQAAERLGCHPRTLLRAIERDRLAAERRAPRGAFLIPAEALRSFRVPRPGRPRRTDEDAAWDLLLDEIDEEFELDEVCWHHLETTVENPSFDPHLHRYLLFHRRIAEGFTWQRAAQMVGMPDHRAQKWKAKDQLGWTILGRVHARRQRIRRGIPDPPPPAPEQRRRGPRPLEPPELTEEDRMRSWTLLEEALQDPVARDGLRLMREGRAGSTRDVEVHRYTALGLQTAVIARLLGSTRRWVQRLRHADFVPSLQQVARRHAAEPDRRRHLEEERQAVEAVRAWWTPS